MTKKSARRYASHLILDLLAVENYDGQNGVPHLVRLASLGIKTFDIRSDLSQQGATVLGCPIS